MLKAIDKLGFEQAAPIQAEAIPVLMQGKDVVGVSDEVLARLMDHEYPGNVRELENIIEHAFVLCRGALIEMAHLPPQLRQTMQ